MIAVELRELLLPAYPCSSLDGVCSSMRYDPALGLFPRGYAGATGTLGDIRLVILVAEPGEPPANAKPLVAGDGTEVDRAAASVEKAFEDGGGAFHRNVRYLLDRCWPGVPFEERMRRTWITEAVLCSAKVTTGPIPSIVEKECATRYLSKQLALLPAAFVIAVGKKANRRIKYCDRKPDAVVSAAGLPGGNFKGAKPSWDAAGAAFQQHLRIVASAHQS